MTRLVSKEVGVSREEEVIMDSEGGAGVPETGGELESGRGSSPSTTTLLSPLKTS